MELPFVLEVGADFVRLRVAGHEARWRIAEASRGLLHALTPARGPGDVALMTEGPDGARTVRLAWSRYDDRVWQTLVAHKTDLAAVFKDGLEIRSGADA